MQKYRHRPTVIEAEKSPTPQTIKTDRFQKIFVPAGDWICSANGRLWAVPANLFPKLYEMVKDGSDTDNA